MGKYGVGYAVEPWRLVRVELSSDPYDMFVLDFFEVDDGLVIAVTGVDTKVCWRLIEEHLMQSLTFALVIKDISICTVGLFNSESGDPGFTAIRCRVRREFMRVPYRFRRDTVQPVVPVKLL